MIRLLEASIGLPAYAHAESNCIWQRPVVASRA
jgi:hypothetical protein